ncbi:MAG: hypothetical protein M1168_00880 [Candidatus Marsarchaeota archaeon]|nr:hypothetical protein [Candidatus Marsarchaeota archaeon]MCL5094524.1 hypothetical protein [Candidatus Marsarchaeota archaeon]
MKLKFKLQSAMEYLITYGWAILIILISMIILFMFAKLPAQFSPSICKFLNGVNCNDILLYSNSSNSISELIVSLSNKQLFSLENPKFNLSLSNKNYSGSCFSSLTNTIPINTVFPGNVFYCAVSTNTNNLPYIFPGIGVNGNIYLNAVNCGFSVNYNVSNQTCNASKIPFNSIYTGTFNVHSIAVSSSRFS